MVDGLFGPQRPRNTNAATRPAIRAETARLRSASVSDGLRAASDGWFEAMLVRVDSAGLGTFSTAVGDVVGEIPEGYPRFPGAKFDLKVGHDGGVALRVAEEFTLPVTTPPEKSHFVNSVASASALSSLIAAGVDVSPIASAARSGQDNAQTALRVLASVPHVGSSTYLLVASLFPVIAASGRLGSEIRSIASDRGASGPVARIGRMEVQPPEMVQSYPHWIEWRMPLYDHGTFTNTRWRTQKEEPEEADEDNDPQDVFKTVIEMSLAMLGPVRVVCDTIGKDRYVRVVSQHPLPDLLVTELEESAAFMADALDLDVKLSFTEEEKVTE